MKTMDTKVKLSTLWIVVILNMIFADIFSVMVEIVDKDTLEIPGNVKVIMAIAAVITNIPILMIYLSRILPYKANRVTNIIAGIFTVIYVIGGGDFAPHYIIISTIEVIILLVIIVSSWNWANPE